MDQPYYGPFDYHPGQDVEARQNNNWVSAHIINPNTDGTYDIVIGRQPHFGWPANNLRRNPNDTRQRGPFNIPQPSFINTQSLNNYGAEWMAERGDAADNFSPENRINDFIDFVRERAANRIITPAEEQMIRDYAEQNINAVFDYGDNYTVNNNNRLPYNSQGGRKRKTRKSKKTRKTRKSKKTKKTRKSRKH